MNKYEILGVIGEGAYGVVLKCRNKETNQIYQLRNAHVIINPNNLIEVFLVAIKKFKETDEDEATRKNISREVKMLKALRHKNVVDLVEAFKRKGRIYLVFEYVEKNLLEVLEETPNGLDAELIRRVIYQILKGLSHCHKHDIIHRDIKPENLLMNRDGTLKLCDFGFARPMPPKVNEIITDYVATRWYRSPELLLSDPSYTFPADIWPVACIMGELIDGNPLFPGKDEIDQLFLIQKLLGPLTPDQHELFIKNARYVGLKFPDLPKAESIERRYLGKLSKKALTFMKAMLKMDPKERLTVDEAMAHPYFDGIRELYSDDVQSTTVPIQQDRQILNNNIRSFGEEKVQVEQEDRDNQGDKKSQTIHHEGDEKNGIYAKLSKENVNSTSSNKINSKNYLSTNKLTPQFTEGHKIMQNTLYNYNIEGNSDQVMISNKRNSNQVESFSSKSGRPLFDTMSLGPKPSKGTQGIVNKQNQFDSKSQLNSTQSSQGGSLLQGNHGLPTIGQQKKYFGGNDIKVSVGSPSTMHNSKISFAGAQSYNKIQYQSPGATHGSKGNDQFIPSKYSNLNVIYNNNTYNYYQQQPPIAGNNSSALHNQKKQPPNFSKKNLY